MVGNSKTNLKIRIKNISHLFCYSFFLQAVLIGQFTQGTVRADDNVKAQVFLETQNDLEIEYYEGTRDTEDPKGTVILEPQEEELALKKGQKVEILNAHDVGKMLLGVLHDGDQTKKGTLEAGLNGSELKEYLEAYKDSTNSGSKKFKLYAKAGSKETEDRFIEVALPDHALINSTSKRKGHVGYFFKASDLLSKFEDDQSSFKVDLGKSKTAYLKELTKGLETLIRNGSEEDPEKLVKKDSKVKEFQEKIFNCQECVLDVNSQLGTLAFEMTKITQKALELAGELQEKSENAYQKVSSLYSLCLLEAYLNACDKSGVNLLKGEIKSYKESKESELGVEVDCKNPKGKEQVKEVLAMAGVVLIAPKAAQSGVDGTLVGDPNLLTSNGVTSTPPLDLIQAAPKEENSFMPIAAMMAFAPRGQSYNYGNNGYSNIFGLPYYSYMMYGGAFSSPFTFAIY